MDDINYFDLFDQNMNFEEYNSNIEFFDHDGRYNLPKNIIYNADQVYGTEVQKYINFTKL